MAALVSQAVNRGALNTVLNVAPDHSLSIKSIAEMVATAAGFGGEIVFNGEGPDGQLRKDVSSERLGAAFPGWADLETSFGRGLGRTIGWYRAHVATR